MGYRFASSMRRPRFTALRFFAERATALLAFWYFVSFLRGLFFTRGQIDANNVERPGTGQRFVRNFITLMKMVAIIPTTTRFITDGYTFAKSITMLSPFSWELPLRVVRYIWAHPSEHYMSRIRTYP